METITKAPPRLKITGTAMLAVATLLIALLAVFMTAGTTVAQTDSSPDPRHATPEPCPGEEGNPSEQAAIVVDSGQYALFDVFWNPGEGELTNNPCPPTVVHVPAVPPTEENSAGTPARDERAASDINITAEPPTIIHIPSSAKINLSDSTAYGDRTYEDVYPQVLAADNKENRDANGDGVGDGEGDGIVWALPACPTDGTSFSGLCISFSSALLNSADWTESIDYLVHHVHQVDIDKQDPRYVLVYDVPATGDDDATDPLWDSSDAKKGTVSVEPGGYNRPQWFFTARGTYEFQVNIQGSPDTKKDDPVSKDDSVSSDVREYIVHVGAEADLGVAMTVTPADAFDTSLGPGDDVTITIAASNAAGKDEAQEAKVDVTLPEGLTYSSHAPAADTFADSDGDGVWTWDADSLAPGASKTLTITATVDAGTRGKTLEVQATIAATEILKITETVDGVETVKQYQVPVLDPTSDNDTATGTITVAGRPNVNPMFVVTRSVPENSSAGTLVGDPIAVKEPDAGDTLTFSLTGEGADNFTASSVSGGAQIAVASGANLDYETKQSYDLILGVSDSKDDASNADSTTDHTIAVEIEITDVIDMALSVSDAYPSFGESVTWTASVGTLPTDATNVVYRWSMFEEQPGVPSPDWDDRRETGAEFTWTGAGPYNVSVKMRVSASYTDGNGTSQNVPQVESDWVRWERR